MRGEDRTSGQLFSYAPAEQMARFPHEFSGGQRQRIGIARLSDGKKPK